MQEVRPLLRQYTVYPKFVDNPGIENGEHGVYARSLACVHLLGVLVRSTQQLLKVGHHADRLRMSSYYMPGAFGLKSAGQLQMACT